MANEAYFSVTGYVATQPRRGLTKNGTRTLSMRVGWTPRRLDTTTGAWADQPSSFVSVQCFRKVAENASICLRKGDPIVLKGTLRVREYVDQAGIKRTSVDVLADSIGHDMSRGMTIFSRSSGQLEQTAVEHEAALVAAGRAPLPGDRVDLAPAGRSDLEAADRADLEAADRADLEAADRPDLAPGDRPDLAAGNRPGVQPGDRPDLDPGDDDARFDEDDPIEFDEAAEGAEAAEPAAASL
jgi:single-strand DNA-binding protein